MKVLIASDHAGFELKSKIISHFKEYQFHDLGCDSAKISVDYPDIAKKLCVQYLEGGFEFGILICGSGIGISIAANRFSKIRAALCCNEETAKLSRQHNNANIICLGQRTINEDDAIKAVKVFLKTEFEGGRHQKRVEKL